MSPERFVKGESERTACTVLQGGHWHTTQTRRYALDCARLQRHHCSPRLKAQWSFSRLLGAQIRTQGRMTHHFFGVLHLPHSII